MKPTWGDWRWRARARNGRLIAGSTEGYKRLQRCLFNLSDVTGVDLTHTTKVRATRKKPNTMLFRLEVESSRRWTFQT